MRKGAGFFYLLLVCCAFVLSGCVQGPLSISKKPINFIESYKAPACDSENYLQNELKKAKDGSDPIYLSINAAAVARNCENFKLSNEFLDLAEESYKFDVDLEGTGTKVGRHLVGILLNDTFADYDGNLYERIMVNVYKGLNFMSLRDYENARVEFNRALLRQDKAKDYFAAQIQATKAELEKAKKEDEHYSENIKNTEMIQEEYSQLFAEFKTSENFTNPYATYLASVFFYLDKDYTNAADKFREISIANPKIKPFQNIRKTLETKARKVKDDKKRYIFLAYEDGFGTIKEEFSLSIPYVFSNEAVPLKLALPTLKKREASYGVVSINGTVARQVSNFDNIFATEFKTELPGIITKTVLSTAAKTAITAIVAKNAGGVAGLITGLVAVATNQADIRVWQTLPKTASIAMVANKGTYSITDATGFEIAKGEVTKGKDVLIWVRSVDKQSAPKIIIMEN